MRREEIVRNIALLLAAICLGWLLRLFLMGEVDSQLFSKREFRIIIGNNIYTRSASVSPNLPITVRFEHDNPDVVRVRMQHPQHTEWSRMYAVGKKVIIQNHTRYMEEGDASYSDFIALDSKGRKRGKIRLTFVPESY